MHLRDLANFVLKFQDPFLSWRKLWVEVFSQLLFSLGFLVSRLRQIRELERLFEHSESVFVCFLLCAHLFLALFLPITLLPQPFFHSGLRITHNTQFCHYIHLLIRNSLQHPLEKLPRTFTFDTFKERIGFRLFAFINLRRFDFTLGFLLD